MSIDKMTYMSHLLLEAAGILLLAAMVLFVAFDIPKCWKMVAGEHHDGRGKNGHYKNKFKNMQLAHNMKKSGSFGITGRGGEILHVDKTDVEETVRLAADDLGIIQDIVYVRDENV